MIGIRTALLCAAASLATLAPALAAGPTVTKVEAGGSSFYADAKGMALYTFDKDADGKSACNGDCAAKWPPLAAPADATPGDGFTTITRDDGTMQWALNGEPLYLFVSDTQPGETKGDGVGGVWHLAK